MYILWGKVRRGKQRGKALGFPTANIALHRNIPEGIYIATTTIEKISYPSAVFVGRAKTFGETTYHAESHILDFDASIYDKWITLRLVKMIRSNQKFANTKDLVAQMKKDEATVRQYFSSRG